MNARRDEEVIIGAWLEDGPQTMPAETRQAIVVGIRTVTQRRRGFRWVPARLGSPVFDLRRAMAALGGIAAVVVVSAVALNMLGTRLGLGGPPDARAPFLGAWITMSDIDGGTQTMTVERAGNNTNVTIVVTDTIASVCSLTPSTMTGTGSVDGNRMTIPTPDYRCDDGSQPQLPNGDETPLNEMLRDLTYVFDPATDTLTEGIGLWVRATDPGATLEPGATPRPALAGQMWPQSTLDEARQAQERADAGDREYAWQVDPLLSSDEWWEHLQSRRAQVVERFMRQVLGWEEFTFNPYAGDDGDGAMDGIIRDIVYLRCGPGEVNPLYPPGPEPEWGELCAPTLDDFRFETVSLDLTQPANQGPTGIWVVGAWRMVAPFAQADPRAAETNATARLEEFLAARVTGEGAEGMVQVQANNDVPLLYATTSGAPYQRYEVERVDGPLWPYGNMTFEIRLFAESDATVVEQKVVWAPGEDFWLDASSTTENGEPVTVPYTSADGEVTASAPSTWTSYWPGKAADGLAPEVWFGLLWPPESADRGGESVGFVDPVAYDLWCAQQGGSALLSAPASAAEIAQQIVDDPDFETTAPVATRVGGLDALSMDVALAPDGRACGTGMTDISRWVHELWEPDLRLRLYLVDLPEGMSVDTMAITIVAPEDRFEDFIEETAPIIESIEFHVP